MATAQAPRTISRSAPHGSERGKPARADKPIAHDGETIEQCVLRSLERYFADLGGAKPHALHEMVVRAAERPALQFALARCGGNQSAAADLLGINRNTLRKKLADYQIT